MPGAPEVDVDARTWISAVVATISCGATAQAEPDYRAQDRFFFGVSGGVVDGAAPVGAYETSYWPNDYLGLSTVVVLAGGDASTYDVAGQLVLALPLRWVQPYAGAMAGWRTTADAVRSRVHLVAGLNGYASRDVRLFVELRDPDLTVIGTDHASQLLVGLRWSPDWFHRARPISKIDAVWWSTLLAAGIWTGATLAR